MHGDVKRKNEKNEDLIEDELPSKKNKNDYLHDTVQTCLAWLLPARKSTNCRYFRQL